MWTGLVGVAGLMSSDLAAASPAVMHDAQGTAWVHRRVMLAGPPAAEVFLRAKAGGDPAAVAKGQARAREIRAEQDALVDAITATGARVVYRFARLTNGVQVEVPASQVERLERLPGVVRVDTVVVHERRLKSAVPFIGGYKAWSALGATLNGEGVRIGIIDTGIDYVHADFGGPGTPAAYKGNDPTTIEPGSFPTAKVVGGTDFVGDSYDASASGGTIAPDDDPLDCLGLQGMDIAGGHGTHVAGIAAGMGVLSTGAPFAGPYNQSVNPAQFRVGPGVAPGASLYALKIFGCSGSTSFTDAALEWAADPNADDDFTDRLDVLNLSLGGSYGLASSGEAEVITNLTSLGSLLVIAAGNDGNTFYVTGWPATATEALSVAATTDTVSLQGLTVKSPASVAGDVACLEGAFTKPLATTGPIEGQLVATSPSNACSSLTNAADLAGKIALLDRGNCPFVAKLQNVQAAGAIAAVVIDSADSDVPFSMGGDGTEVDIPGVMIRKVDGDAIRQALGQGVTVRLDPDKEFVSMIGADQVASFSSRGPRARDNALKPDIGAPGVAIDSAGVGTGTGPRQLQGTSMACPMVAGAAALVRQAQPDFSPAQVKALLMNTASAAKGPDGEAVPVSLVGAGRVQVDQAIASRVSAAAVDSPGAVGVSFGALIASAPVSESRDIAVRNDSDAPVTLGASAVLSYPTPGVSVTVSQPSLTIAAHASATVSVTLALDPAKLPSDLRDPLTPAQAPYIKQARHYLSEAGGHVVFTGAPAPLAVPFHAVVRPASETHVVLDPTSCQPVAPGGALTLSLADSSAYPGPITSVFELGLTSPAKGAAGSPGKMADVLAVGVSNNLPTLLATDPPTPFAEGSVYFGVVVDGQWTTPAFGQQSLITVIIDTNNDKKADFSADIAPLSKDGPYLDVLAVTTYNAKTGQPTKSRRFANLFPRDQLAAPIFNNSVVVLPITIGDLGLKQGSASFNYQVYASAPSPISFTDRTEWATYNLDKAVLDTSSNGKEGRPFYENPSSIPIKLGAGATAGQLPQALLLHHTNVAGKRHEIVDLNAVAGTTFDLVAAGVVNTPSGSHATATVSNKGPGAASSVSLTIAPATGSRVTEATTAAGECSLASGKAVCSFTSLAPGASADVTLTLDSSGPPIAATITAAAPGCDSDFASNTASIKADPSTGHSGGSSGASGSSGQPGSPDDPAPLAGGEIGGGCDCSLGAGHRAHPAGGVLALALGSLGLRRLRRRRAAR